MSVIVIPFTVPRSRYDERGRLLERQGDVVVSHGIDEVTGRTVILPCEPFAPFVSQHCTRRGDEFYLKDPTPSGNRKEER